MTGTNLQGTNIISMIVPTNHADTYATHDSFYGKGGWREVNTLDERNAIPEERRRIGMVVYVRETFKAYLLKNSLSNAGWVPFNIDGEEYVTEDEMNAAIADALENYNTKAEIQDILGDYATKQWVIDYVGDIDLTDYQKKVDNNLQTEDKSIVGAINELNSKPHIDTYSKAEEDALLALKADKATTYTKDEVDDIIENLPIPDDVYSKAETDELLAGKANVGDSYTKAEIDEIIEDLPISENVYTKDETNALLDGKVSKYATLPTEGVEVGTIAQYVGRTSGGKKQGYFYQYVGEPGLVFTPTQSEGAEECTTEVTVSIEDFKAYLNVLCEGRNFTADDIVSGHIGYHNITSTYSFSAFTPWGNFFSISVPIADLTEAGFTFEPALGPRQGVDFTCNLTNDTWKQKDVQAVPTVEEIAALVEESDIFVPTDEYEAKCAQYEADIAALQQENAELQTTVNTLEATLVAAQVKLDYVYDLVTTPHYDVLPDEEP